jgi:nucleotide-binding universal stress UspA family protein
MAAATDSTGVSRPVLLCFDGSDDAASAIAQAGEVLGARPAIVLTAWEPFAVWQPYDPGAILGAGLGKLVSHELRLDEIARDLAREKMEEGIALANKAGFAAEGRIAKGKPWKAICDAAEELDAAIVVLGARGLSQVASVLLGSVSCAVAVHAKRPVLIAPSLGG